MGNYEAGLAFAQQADKKDPLAAFRDQFYIPYAGHGKESVYLLGNSLGLQPITAQSSVFEVLEDWKNLGIDGYFKAKNPWLTYNESLSTLYADIVGAQSSEIVAMNTLSLNLHLMMVSFYRPTKTRFKIMIEKGAFPSDQYAVKSQLEFHGFDPVEGLIEVAPRKGEKTLRTEDIIQIIEEQGDQTALILFGGMNYYTGQLFDMEAITRAGHAQDCVVGFDLAHAAGNVPMKLHDWDVDFACWCSYKYLNGGPASIAACFVHERHGRNFELPRFAGWWGHEVKTRFLMGSEFIPSSGAAGWQLSNAPVLSLAPVKASLEIFAQAGMEALREKSLKLTGYLEFLLDDLGSDVFHVITPRDPAQRGCQLSIIVHQDGKKVHSALMEAGVVCDWREPDCIRIAPAPLYNRFQDVYDFVQIFSGCLVAHSGVTEHYKSA
ncbi:MAG: kynureninase [Alphaproteobacteria bacterium CG_4_9_14_3_um_filter_47_13]|nr:MAG: kynureninase [Alphaproteobacteria bacterium CG_4_9_14_3_um_filter_47_13]